jgi:hypothetical protein
MVFLTFLKFFLKFREQIPCREAASNALTDIQYICVLMMCIYIGHAKCY